MRSREHGGGQNGDEPRPQREGDRANGPQGRSPTPMQAGPVQALPAKLYFRIGEVAQLVGVEAHVLRYWETEFRSVRPQKSARGQRVYSRRDVETLVRVKDLLYDRGFTIMGARRELRERGVEPREPTDPAVRNGSKMRETLLALRQEILKLLDET